MLQESTKIILKNSLATLLSLMLCIFVLEICFRITSKFSSTSKISSDRPLSYYGVEGSHFVTDYDYKVEKEPNSYRIISIGDSFTYPTYLDFDDTYSKRLERMLNLHSSAYLKTKAEVINFGSMGASTVSETKTFEKAVSFKPDLIILQITLNDPEPKNFHVQKKLNSGKFNFGEFEIRKENHPILFYWSSLGYLAKRIHNKQTGPALIKYYQEMYEPGERWDNFTKALIKMKKSADSKNIKLVAMVFPLFDNSLDETYPYQRIHTQITSYLDSINIKSLDLLSAYSGMNSMRLTVLPGQDAHPNEIAHRIAADNLYKWLETNKIIPADLYIKKSYLKRGRHPVEEPEFMSVRHN